MTSLGHAGMLIETTGGSIVCDPWFLPQFLGSWFVFPRNDRLDQELFAQVCSPDYLYISHIHADHLDEQWLRDHLDKGTTVLLPDFPTGELERTLRNLGFHRFLHTKDREELSLGGSLTIAIHTETSITDGPGGDSALVVSDGTARIVNQNDCRTNDLNALRQHGEVDLHWLQYSGAIWYPMVYEETSERMRELINEKVESQTTRALRYVEAIGARAVVPSAGPPCFLDPDLFGFNLITGDEATIFSDQPRFIDALKQGGHTGILAIPGTCISIENGDLRVEHPMSQKQIEQIFTNKLEYLREYQQDWSSWLAQHRASWSKPTAELLDTIKAWWEPLMRSAPTVCDAIGANCLLRLGDLDIILDFPSREVRVWNDEPFAFSFNIQRELVETVVARRAHDWSNALFLSCRFTAWRQGPFNEYVYNFFKSLSEERMSRTEAEALRKLSPDRGGIADETIVIDGYEMQRTCPHRGADLAVFGEVSGDDLVCTLHGWKFDLATGTCRNADDRALRIRQLEA
ncbi:MAG: Rieske 2Fe-2S domain-containing protein [Actinobacteria bacterium]|nr:Rieske 2Fe-2S domain-containing protein [Actinomycetota bacterium]